ncbi:hypothetical protein ABFS83_05G096400 [Erythranthe nasuta]
MVKRRREPDFNGANTETADNRTVFVDTSLDTHLAVTVSNSDTVSDFKRKTVLEHMRCFPEIGEIHIHSLKVKRRAVFYHLPETMLVRSALQAGSTSWFLSADASAIPVRQLNQDSLRLDPSYGVKMDAKNIDDNHCRDLLPVVNVLQALPMPLPDGVSEKNLASEMIPACEVDKSLEKATDIPSNSYSEEDCIGIDVSRAKKKRKISHTEDVCHDPILKDTSALPHLSGNGGIGSSELLCAPTDPIPQETHKEESILYHKEMDVNMALLDSSTQDPNEEVKDTDKKEAEFSILTQTKQALDGVDTGNKTVEEKTQLSAAHAHFPAVVEFTDVEKDIKTSEGKIEKSKRRKKRKHAESDVQEKLPSKDQKVGIEALTTEENLNGFVNSEQKGGHEASLQVLSSKGEEKLEEIHTAPVITDDPAKTSENGGVGINFKEYFLPGQNKEITDSGDKTEEIRTSKDVRDDVLPSVGVSTDLQNSIKKTKSKRSEKKTRVTNDSGSRQGDSSAQNRAFDEVISKSSKRSSKSRVNEKNPSLDKSSSKKTETFLERRGNKRLHSSLNVTDKLVMKTSKKKSMLTIPGAIFQDNSGESSADDNGTVHLKGSIASPPDSSSESDNAIEKGEFLTNIHVCVCVSIYIYVGETFS